MCTQIRPGRNGYGGNHGGRFCVKPLATGAGVGALSTGGWGALGLVSPAWAKDEPPIGTWPAGSQGNSVFIGITVPRTGTYAVQGEDELKGYQLAVEHINSGHRR